MDKTPLKSRRKQANNALDETESTGRCNAGSSTQSPLSSLSKLSLSPTIHRNKTVNGQAELSKDSSVIAKEKEKESITSASAVPRPSALKDVTNTLQSQSTPDDKAIHSKQLTLASATTLSKPIDKLQPDNTKADSKQISIAIESSPRENSESEVESSLFNTPAVMQTQPLEAAEQDSFQTINDEHCWLFAPQHHQHTRVTYAGYAKKKRQDSRVKRQKLKMETREQRQKQRGKQKHCNETNESQS